MEKPKFLISGGGIIVIAVAGHVYPVAPSQEHYSEIRDAVIHREWGRILPLLPDMPFDMRKYIAVWVDGAFDLGGAL